MKAKACRVTAALPLNLPERGLSEPMKVVGDTSKSRIIAAFIDNLFAFAATMIVVSLVPETLPAVKAVCFFLVYLAYFIVLEALWSRTFGKFFQGLVVRKVDGSHAAWKASISIAEFSTVRGRHHRNHGIASRQNSRIVASHDQSKIVPSSWRLLPS